MKTSLLLISIVLAAATGCSMCCGPFDYDYPAFGGKHPRAVRNQGRVGSILSDPLNSITSASADSNLAEPEAPLDSTDDDDELLDTEIEDLNSDDNDMLEELRKLDERLEGIEPLRNNDNGSGSGAADEDNTTASSKWKPRPLRNQIR